MQKQNNALRVSQNFLTSAAITKRIVNLAKFQPGEHVVEIGPGKGHITRALLQKRLRVTAVELDPKLCAALQKNCAGAPNLRLVQGDFLAWPLPEGPYKVFANIPFNQTTAILRRLTQGPRPPEEAWLVVEKGAAKRYMGRPAETPASLRLKPWFEAEVRYHFRREDFHPMPGAQAVLLHLKRKARPDLPPAQRGAYLRFVAAQRVTTRDTLYIQWLCLFRRYWDRGGR